MTRCRRGEGGETLPEILIALVIIGLVVGALFGTITTTATAAKAHRDFGTADALLRAYAEATKVDVRRDCPTSSTFTTTTIPGFVVTSNTDQCPVDATHVRQVDLTVTLPNGAEKKLSVDVRTP